MIHPEQEIRIVIRNLVKVYDRAGCFARQWNSGQERRKRLGIQQEYRSFKDFLNIGWLFGLFAFVVCFTYGYLEHSFWIFVFSFIVYALTLYLWRKIRMYLFFRFGRSEEHTSELQSRSNLVCRLLLEKKKK